MEGIRINPDSLTSDGVVDDVLDVLDVLDDLAELVAMQGGAVPEVPAESMPSTTGLAAIYRC